MGLVVLTGLVYVVWDGRSVRCVFVARFLAVHYRCRRPVKLLKRNRSNIGAFWRPSRPIILRVRSTGVILVARGGGVWFGRVTRRSTQGSRPVATLYYQLKLVFTLVDLLPEPRGETKHQSTGCWSEERTGEVYWLLHQISLGSGPYQDIAIQKYNTNNVYNDNDN